MCWLLASSPAAIFSSHYLIPPTTLSTRSSHGHRSVLIPSWLLPPKFEQAAVHPARLSIDAWKKRKGLHGAPCSDLLCERKPYKVIESTTTGQHALTSVFAPYVAMLLLAAWSTSGWLPGGHAMRMALDLGLHRALEKLADSNTSALTSGSDSSGGKKRSDDEERDLGTPCGFL